MSLQICLNCRKLGMTWSVNDEDQTWWFCSLCNFEIQEDESKECCCGKCDFTLPWTVWLMKDGEGFYWCFNCNEKTDEIKPNTFTKEVLHKILDDVKT